MSRTDVIQDMIHFINDLIAANVLTSAFVCY